MANSPYIYMHPQVSGRWTLSLLREPSSHPDVSVGESSAREPTPATFTENPRFWPHVHAVLAAHAHEDPELQSQAAAFASEAGALLGTGSRGARRGRRQHAGGDGAGGASSQGGAGGGGTTGFMHIADRRNPPDFGRIPFPDDILGSLQVDSHGVFVDGHGCFQDSGTYRLLTRDGCLGLPPYLRQKLIERLRSLS